MIKTQADKIKELIINKIEILETFQQLMQKHNIDIFRSKKGGISFAQNGQIFFESEYDLLSSVDLQELIYIYYEG